MEPAVSTQRPFAAFTMVTTVPVDPVEPVCVLAARSWAGAELMIARADMMTDREYKNC